MISENKINDDLVLSEEKNGLTFGTDAYLLASFVKRNAKSSALDLCSGSGVIALILLNKNKIKNAHCVDLRDSCITLCRQNAEKNGFSDRLTASQADATEFSSPSSDSLYDICVCNPPYLRAECGGKNAHDESYISRHETSAVMSDFAACMARCLRHGGDCYIVYRPDRLCELTVSCRAAHLEPKRLIFVYPTPSHRPCLVLLHCKKGGAEGMVVTKPLIIYKNEVGKEYTDDLKYIYENTELPEEFYK